MLENCKTVTLTKGKVTSQKELIIGFSAMIKIKILNEIGLDFR